MESSFSSSTLLSDTPAFSAALSRPAFSTKLSSFFSSILEGARAHRGNAPCQDITSHRRPAQRCARAARGAAADGRRARTCARARGDASGGRQAQKSTRERARQRRRTSSGSCRPSPHCSPPGGPCRRSPSSSPPARCSPACGGRARGKSARVNTRSQRRQRRAFRRHERPPAGQTRRSRRQPCGRLHAARHAAAGVPRPASPYFLAATAGCCALRASARALMRPPACAATALREWRRVAGRTASAEPAAKEDASACMAANCERGRRQRAAKRPRAAARPRTGGVEGQRRRKSARTTPRRAGRRNATASRVLALRPRLTRLPLAHRVRACETHADSGMHPASAARRLLAQPAMRLSAARSPPLCALPPHGAPPGRAGRRLTPPQAGSGILVRAALPAAAGCCWPHTKRLIRCDPRMSTTALVAACCRAQRRGRTRLPSCGARRRPAAAGRRRAARRHALFPGCRCRRRRRCDAPRRRGGRLRRRQQHRLGCGPVRCGLTVSAQQLTSALPMRF